MRPRIVLAGAAILLLFNTCGAQVRPFPAHLIIARHTFIDVGPPNDYYEVIDINSSGNGLSIERALITPSAGACLAPAKIETSSGVLHESIDALLQARNPCSIPEKDLRRERARCKKCLTFSGVDLTMEVSCGAEDRLLKMDVLDRDVFTGKSGTPENTSWSMDVLQKLDSVLGPGAWDKPMFSLVSPSTARLAPDPLVDEILAGRFDPLFGPNVKVSAIAQEAERGAIPQPTVALASIAPESPADPQLPPYPAIARAARVQGLVLVEFDVGPDGIVRNIAFPGDRRLGMLESGLEESISKWTFPRSSSGSHEKAAIRFDLHCDPNASSAQAVRN